MESQTRTTGIKILVDCNIEGQALLLLGMLAADGWLELVSLQLVTLADSGLPLNSSDRDIWHFAQKNEMVLLTDNRNRKGKDSLEQTIGEENTSSSLPVFTIGNAGRLLSERKYREQCVNRLLEILLDWNNFLGTGRIFIP